jgi:hypothetical protein
MLLKILIALTIILMYYDDTKVEAGWFVSMIFLINLSLIPTSIPPL